MTLGGLDPAISTAENYRAWAEEARGRSPAYDSLAMLVADDDTILSFLGTLPSAKRQPNLLFAAARYLLGSPPDITTLRALVGEKPAALARVMLARRTQTNEPARCATLLPALAQQVSGCGEEQIGLALGRRQGAEETQDRVVVGDQPGQRVVRRRAAAHLLGPLPVVLRGADRRIQSAQCHGRNAMRARPRRLRARSVLGHGGHSGSGGPGPTAGSGGAAGGF